MSRNNTSGISAVGWAGDLIGIAANILEYVEYNYYYCEQMISKILVAMDVQNHH